MPVGVDRRGGRVHVAVLLEVGLERAHEVGRVLVVVLDDRRHRVLVERAHLLGMGGEHAEQQPVRARADVLGDRDVGAAQDVEHELGLLDRAAQLGRVGVEAREADGAVALQPRREPAGGAERRLRRAVPARRRAAARTRAARRPAAPCAARARPGTRPAIVATTWRGRSVESSAQSTTAPRARSQPSRAARRTTSCGSSSSGFARSSSRNEPRRFCSTSSLASSTATSVSEATAARCEELGRVRRRRAARLAEREHAADHLVARG